MNQQTLNEHDVEEPSRYIFHHISEDSEGKIWQVEQTTRGAGLVVVSFWYNYLNVADLVTSETVCIWRIKGGPRYEAL